LPWKTSTDAPITITAKGMRGKRMGAGLPI
jgi:hypothetical protein